MGEPVLTIPHLDPLTFEIAGAVHGGDVDALRRLLGPGRSWPPRT